jgi:bacteriorhodopsin
MLHGDLFWLSCAVFFIVIGSLSLRSMWRARSRGQRVRRWDVFFTLYISLAFTSMALYELWTRHR